MSHEPRPDSPPGYIHASAFGPYTLTPYSNRQRCLKTLRASRYDKNRCMLEAGTTSWNFVSAPYPGNPELRSESKPSKVREKHEKREENRVRTSVGSNLYISSEEELLALFVEGSARRQVRPAQKKKAEARCSGSRDHDSKR